MIQNMLLDVCSFSIIQWKVNVTCVTKMWRVWPSALLAFVNYIYAAYIGSKHTKLSWMHMRAAKLIFSNNFFQKKKFLKKVYLKYKMFKFFFFPKKNISKFYSWNNFGYVLEPFRKIYGLLQKCRRPKVWTFLLRDVCDISFHSNYQQTRHAIKSFKCGNSC